MKRALRGTLLAAVSAMLSVVPASAQESAADSAEAAALAAANGWLEIVDAGAYAESWTDAAAAFREAVDEAQWAATMRQVRAPLGDPASRELAGARYTTDLPNAPPGEYVIIQFRTQFAGRDSIAVETVVPMKEQDGSWRVSGYFIR